MLLGYDHGIGHIVRRRRELAAVPTTCRTAQFYAVGFDMDVPYNVYGGLQDNGCYKGPSTRRGGGNIPFEAWTNVGCADGFYNEVDWRDSRWLYNESQFGGIARLDQLTGTSGNLGQNRPAAAGGRAVPLELERADPRVAAQQRRHLPRRAGRCCARRSAATRGRSSART